MEQWRRETEETASEESTTDMGWGDCSGWAKRCVCVCVNSIIQKGLAERRARPGRAESVETNRVAKHISAPSNVCRAVGQKERGRWNQSINQLSKQAKMSRKKPPVSFIRIHTHMQNSILLISNRENIPKASVQRPQRFDGE